MRFWQRLRYIEPEREGEAALLLGLTTRCSGRTRVSRRLLVRRKRRATRRAAERERYADLRVSRIIGRRSRHSPHLSELGKR
jgi:hypothetical protein